MSEKIKEYSNGDITIVWKPGKCIHSGKCVEALPSVYHPKEQPWILPENASTEAIKAQIATCPSQALTYYVNGEERLEDAHAPTPQAAKTGGPIQAEVMQDGPLIVYGPITVKGIDGKEETQDKRVAFCRCGVSSNKPYCDGSHRKSDFKD